MKKPIELLTSLYLPDFPSGSAINYREGKLYLVGDDANTILILDQDYHVVDSKQIFDYPEKRMPKPMKADLESSTLVHLDGRDYLMTVGSGATRQRERMLMIPFSASTLDVAHMRVIDIEDFIHQLKRKGIPEINLEGMTVIGSSLAFSNRSNRQNSINHVIFTGMNFWIQHQPPALNISTIQIPASTDSYPGISDLCYVSQTDTLLVAFSTELTDNAYDDGAIGDSYLGWIHQISQKLQNPTLPIDQLHNLRDADPDFKNQKIEGLCVESIHNEFLLLHMISDDDQGHSKLFNVKLMLGQ